MASTIPLTPPRMRRKIPCLMMSTSEASKRYREGHRRLGLCIMCSRKPKTGMSQCRVCLSRMRERRMEQLPLFCGECKKLIKSEERNGRRFHKLCAQKRMARKYPLSHKSAVIAYQKRHRTMGLCYSCPRKAFKSGLCRKHYKMAKERNYKATG